MDLVQDQLPSKIQAIQQDLRASENCPRSSGRKGADGKNEEDDAAAYSSVETLHAKPEAVVRKEGAVLDDIFMKEANIKKPVIASYGRVNVEHLSKVRKAYDPNLVFRKLVSGGQNIHS